ncbi:Uma2 family endonuclease [Prochlorothrix hollandica]|uniref:Putative restriction endonuclease domain-containing protein n=1 Tax=Prochlorothrix hollandica PCC 9006 = CALU 1027 TaxID=317619 RepID=A0A0M2PXW2_PROHO|nr:Uma2 family endonuclease [Prochlorothrix hollandica]KKI99221.1 hypothetical protein PROH_15860 [Prochlorothrix hollandica PCC 9006 = CALU 1027]
MVTLAPTFPLHQLRLAPGSVVTLSQVSWSAYEALLETFGDRPALRLTYDRGTLHLQMPLPKHEKAKALLGACLTLLLDEWDLESECLGSTTLKSQTLNQGIEPDDCFYITHQAAVRGKDRLDLDGGDPPPDLAIEVDNTSPRDLRLYHRLGVPEVWVYNGEILIIYHRTATGYQPSPTSQFFPGLPLAAAIAEHLMLNQTQGRTAILKRFRAWVQSQR